MELLGVIESAFGRSTTIVVFPVTAPISGEVITLLFRFRQTHGAGPRRLWFWRTNNWDRE